ncbi:hypothetical protein D3C84_892840 [compost metagenome]
MLLDLGHRLGIDQRAGGDTFVQTVTNLQLSYRDFQLLGEGIVYAVLDIQAVGAHAGLAIVAVFGDQCAFHCLIKVGIIEYDERRVSAQF